MHSGTTEPPLCLMIGYTDGMQIWSVSVSRTSKTWKIINLPFLFSLVSFCLSFTTQTIIVCNDCVTVGVKGQGVLAELFTDLRPAETCLNSHVTNKQQKKMMKLSFTII